MFKKSSLIFVLCLVAGIIFATEKVDYKKFMEGYANAYSSMNSKKLAGYADEKFISKLKWEFHEFRKAHQKPQLILKDITVKNNTVNCTATLLAGGKTRYKDLAMTFILKDGKIQSCSENREKNQEKTQAKVHARDFWSAAKIADGFAVVEVEQHKSTKFVKLLPQPKDYANEEIKLPKWTRSYMKSGKYLLPVLKEENVYNSVGMGYRCPAYDPATADVFIKQWQEFKTLDKEKETSFLKKIINDKASPELVQSAIVRMALNGYFKDELNKDDVAFWEKVIFDEKQARELVSWLIYNLAKSDFKTVRPLLERALKDERFTTIAAPAFVKNDNAGYRKLVLEWLKNDKMREIALKNSFLMMKDKKFTAEAMRHFKNSGVEEVKQYLPLLLAKDNPEGNKVIKNILDKQPKEYGKLIPQIYTIIIRTGNPVWTDEMLKLAQTKDEKKIYIRLKPMAMAYLCRYKNSKAVELTENYLQTIKDDKRKQQACLMAFSIVYRKPFHSIEDIKKTTAQHGGRKKKSEIKNNKNNKNIQQELKQ